MGKTYDIPLRKLVKEIPSALFRLVFERDFNSKSAKILDVKLPKLFEREADLVVEYGGEIYHLEIQSVDDPEMGFRMAFYHLLIWKNYSKPPHQAVIYVGEKPFRKMKNSLNSEHCKFEFPIVDLNSLDCSYFLESDNPYDWVLSLLCKMENEERDLKRAFEKILHLPQPEREKIYNFAVHLLRLRPKRLNYLLREVSKMPITIDVERDPLYLQGLEKAKKEDALRLFKTTKWKPEKIAQILNLPTEKVVKWLKEEGLLKENK